MDENEKSENTSRKQHTNQDTNAEENVKSDSSEKPKYAKKKKVFLSFLSSFLFIIPKFHIPLVLCTLELKSQRFEFFIGNPQNPIATNHITRKSNRLCCRED